MKIDRKVIRNALLYKEKGFYNADILISNEKIEKIAEAFSIKISSKETVLDATGLICMPGIVDAHTHFKLKVGENAYNSDDFISGTKAAISGGVTSVIDFTNPNSSIEQGVKEKLKDAKISYCDYSFHSVISSVYGLKNFKRQIKRAVLSGIPTFKIFTAYKKRGLMLSNQEITALLKETAKVKAMVCVHAEDEGLIEKNAIIHKNIKGMKALPLIRSEKTEINAVKNILELNKSVNSRLYFVHISSAKSALLIKSFRKKGMKVFAETCPQYLIFDESLYLRKKSFLFSFCPPVRDFKNKKRIWKLLGKDYFSNIATDSCAFHSSHKKKWGNDISKLYMGVSSNQFLLSLIFSEGVLKNKISFGQMQKMLCLNPALTMGIENKGCIKEGFDADLLLFDPLESFVVNKSLILNNCDYSPYEGMRLFGAVKKVFLRGILAFDGKNFFSPRGKFLKRKTPKY